MTDIPNLIFGTLWGSAMFAAWSVVLIRRWQAYNRYTDRRSIVGLAAAVLLWLTAVLFAGALVASVLADTSDVGVTVRGLLFGLGTGAFTGAGILEARRAWASPG